MDGFRGRLVGWVEPGFAGEDSPNPREAIVGRWVFARRLARPTLQVIAYFVRAIMSTMVCIVTINLFIHLFPPPEKNALPEAVETALKNATEMEMLSINQLFLGLLDEDEEKKYTDPKVGFHERKPLGRTTVKDEETLKKIRAELSEAINKKQSPLERRLCFEPRHGLRVKDGKDTIDLLICFHCWTVIIFRNEKHVSTLAIERDPQKLFNQILKDAKVPLADGAEKYETDKKDK
jgi:hypothetical protein